MEVTVTATTAVRAPNLIYASMELTVKTATLVRRCCRLRRLLRRLRRLLRRLRRLRRQPCCARTRALGTRVMEVTVTATTAVRAPNLIYASMELTVKTATLVRRCCRLRRLLRRLLLRRRRRRLLRLLSRLRRLRRLRRLLRRHHPCCARTSALEIRMLQVTVTATTAVRAGIMPIASMELTVKTAAPVCRRRRRRQSKTATSDLNLDSA